MATFGLCCQSYFFDFPIASLVESQTSEAPSDFEN